MSTLNNYDVLLAASLNGNIITTGTGTLTLSTFTLTASASGTVVVQGGVLGTPASGTLTNCTGLPVGTGISGLGTGVATFLATPSSANLAAAVTGETGTGSLVFSAGPTFTGTASFADISASNSIATTGSAQIVSGGNIIAASGVGAGGGISFAGHAWIVSGGADIFKFWNSTFNGAPLIRLGGDTTAFPAIKRSSTTIQARLADDSNFATFQGVHQLASNAVTGLSAGALAASTNASIVLTDGAGQVYRIPCII